MHRCTCCQQGWLHHEHLDSDLPLVRCDACHGMAFELSEYADWRDKQAQPVGEPEVPARDSTLAQRQRVVPCPACKRLMGRYRAHAGENSPYIDVCLPCNVVWLDGGLWADLVAIGLHTSVASMLTAPWQLKLRQILTQSRQRAALQQTLGEQSYQETLQVLAWLRAQKRPKDILQMLHRELTRP